MQKLNYEILNDIQNITYDINYISKSIWNINLTLLNSSELKTLNTIYNSLWENKLATASKITLQLLSFKYKKYE